MIVFNIMWEIGIKRILEGQKNRKNRISCDALFQFLCATAQFFESKHGSHQWNSSMGVINGSHQWKSSMGVINGSHQWESSMGVISGSHQWEPSVEVINGSHQWESSVESLENL